MNAQPPSLTAREREVLLLRVEGLRCNAIARVLGISAFTTRNTLCHLQKKLDARTITAAVVQAYRLGLWR